MEDKMEQASETLRRLVDRLKDFERTQPNPTTLRVRNRSAYDRYDSIKQQLFVASLRIGKVHALIEMGEEAEDKHLAQVEALIREARTDLSALGFRVP